MADVKALEMSHDEWRELLEPYGWADITTRSLVAPRGVSLGVAEYGFRMVLKGSPDGALDEWAHRSYLLDQARQAVDAVKARGYVFIDAPRIEFAGRYKYSVDRGAVPEWYAEAYLEFSVGAR
jgi:hypothetical protein